MSGSVGEGRHYMTKDTDKVVKFWLMSSKDNFETASATLKAGRYNFAMFMCQQAVEALLKAVSLFIRMSGLNISTNFQGWLN